MLSLAIGGKEIKLIQGKLHTGLAQPIAHHKAKKKNTLVTGNAGDKKNVHARGHNFFSQ